MRRFLQSAYIGRPQFAAAALLLAYLLQCLWLAAAPARSSWHDNQQALRIYEGLEQWRGGPIAGLPGAVAPERLPPAQFAGNPSSVEAHASSRDRSPLYYLIAGAPFLPWPSQFEQARPLGRWLALAPYLFFGVMLGASLWYVARRLYGNTGGYIALALYCFSPAMILHVSATFNQAEMGGVWGAFGAVFTAIAAAHTLYAPREVILWNWRRILLLGVSFALAVGNQFSLAVVVAAALPLMLWVAPVRRRAALAIWAAACGVALAILFASYFVHPRLFWEGLRQARWLEFDPRAFTMRFPYIQTLQRIFRGAPALMLALPAALAGYFAWKRTRYFGNTAPLLVALLILIMGTASPTFAGAGFELAALTFLFVFVAGVLADLVESRRGLLVSAGVTGLLIAAALWNLLELARLG